MCVFMVSNLSMNSIHSILHHETESIYADDYFFWKRQAINDGVHMKQNMR